MQEDWIDTVMRMNAAIIEAEARLSTQVILLINTLNEGHDTMEAENLLESYRNKLVVLRDLQKKLLQEPEAHS